MPDIAARLAALLAFTPTPIVFSESLTLAMQTVASIEAAIALALPAPDISAQMAIIAAQVAAVAAQVAAINAQLAVLVALESPLAVGGVFAYAYDGAAATLGAELGAAVVADMTGHVNALLLVTPSPVAWAAVSDVMKVTP
jgi:hypothetical protein